MTPSRPIIPLAVDSVVRDGEAPVPASPPPLSLYVHYPWCVRKCPYCDFNSHPAGSYTEAEENRYIDALIGDLEQALPGIWGRTIQSVFIGGGTPSLLSAAALDRLLSAVRMLPPLAPLAEITLEANPGTVESARFRDYRAAGINRLSLGIQSFNDAHLRALGRIHDRREALRAVDIAQTQFERVNLDLMYALPGQTPGQAAEDIETALATGATHLSCYHLTLEPNTAFHRAPPTLPDDDTAADMQEYVEDRLADAGFGHYEISAFARGGQQCQHNLNYWTFGDYLGIGAGAHSKLSLPDGIVREARHRHPQAYLAAAPERRFIQESRVIAGDELPFEFMMNALRLTGGFAKALFPLRTGLSWPVLTAELREAQRLALIEDEGGRLRPSQRGRRFLNDLLALFLRDG